VAKPVYSRVTTWRQREAVLGALRRWKLQTPDALYDAFRRNPKIADFVETYYAEDFTLYQTARARMAGVTDGPAGSPRAMAAT
jgi:hypothetical protein